LAEWIVLREQRSLIVALVVLASAIGITCGGRDEPQVEGTAAQIEEAFEQFSEAWLNGDAARLQNLVSNQCPEKSEFLDTAAAFNLVSDLEFTYQLSKNSLNVEFMEPDHVVVRPRANATPPLLNGVPLTDYDEDPNAKWSFEREFVNDDGAWRLLDCGDDEFKLEF
jgi:hypothetical protein